MLSSFVLTTLFLAEQASAHGRLTEPMTRVGHTGYENDPVGFQGRSMTKFACRHEKNPNVTPKAVNAGDLLDLEWSITANHVGDAAVYISYDHDVAIDSIYTMEFFKIANIPKTRDQPLPYTIKLPDWLPAGQATLRWEWYALHVNPTIELYVQCSDIVITGKGSPDELTVADVPKYAVVTADGTPRTQFLYNTDGVLYRDGFNPGVYFLTGPECAMGFNGNNCLETMVGSQGWVDVGADQVDNPTTTAPDYNPTTTTTTQPPASQPTPPPSDNPGQMGYDFYVDSSDDKNTRKTLANIGGLLAQCAWESGGDVPFHACDENNWSGTATASCTQRSDVVYHEMTGNGASGACYVDPAMHVVAETHASWTVGPMECTPGTDTERCCWWGRGAIQTTGPFNYGKLQSEVVDHMGLTDPLTNQDMNLCTNPEAICQNDELKFVGAMYYWVSVVQQETCFSSMLTEYAGPDDASAWNNNGGTASCRKYSSGIGGSINNGNWQVQAHEEAKRQIQFEHMMTSLKNGYNSYDGHAPSTAAHCTGDAKIDRIMELGNIKLDSAVEDHGVYTWAGFCSTLRLFVNSNNGTPAPTASPVPTPMPTNSPTASPVATAYPSLVPTASPVATAYPSLVPTASPVATPVTTTTTPGTPSPVAAPTDNGVIVDESKQDGAKCAGADWHDTPACASGLGCFAEDIWYSGCKPSCPSGWACESEPANLGTAFPQRTVGRKCAGTGFTSADSWGSCADGLSCYKRSWDSAPSSWSGCFVSAPTSDWILEN